MFTDRVDAGRRLAARLGHLAGADVVVLGLPRGGIPVAAEVARALGAPLDVIMVRKLGVPYHRELAMGAVGEDGARVLSREVMQFADVGADELEVVEREARIELERRTRRYRTGRPRIELDGRVAVVVDDGIATGSTATVACRIAREQGATRVVLAVPVAPSDWLDRMSGVADEYVAVETPVSFGAVGAFYREFSQVSDDEVVAILAEAAPDETDRMRPPG